MNNFDFTEAAYSFTIMTGLLTFFVALTFYGSLINKKKKNKHENK